MKKLVELYKHAETGKLWINRDGGKDAQPCAIQTDPDGTRWAVIPRGWSDTVRVKYDAVMTAVNERGAYRIGGVAPAAVSAERDPAWVDGLTPEQRATYEQLKEAGTAVIRSPKYAKLQQIKRQEAALAKLREELARMESEG